MAQLQLTREQEDMPNPATGESRGHYTERRIRTMSRHADFSIVRVTPDIIFISDMNIGGISVTNDAEWVVKTLLEKFGPLEIVYRDSDGQWDELLHDGANFLGFSPYKGEDPEFTSIEQPDMEMKLHERRYT